jgi:hypothetical protein
MSDVIPAPFPATPNVFRSSAGISLGLGLTSECNLSCAFCYRDPARADRLSLEQVKSVMDFLSVRSANLGTGENGIHPEFKAMLAYLRTQPVKLTSLPMATVLPFWKIGIYTPSMTLSFRWIIRRKQNRTRNAAQETGN